MNKHSASQSYEHMLREIQRQIYNSPGEIVGAEGEYHVVYTFKDSVIAKDYFSNTYYEIPYTKMGDQIFVGQAQEVEETFVSKALKAIGIDPATKGIEPDDQTELTGPIVMKNLEKRIAYAAVLVPGEADHDGEIVTKAKIEEAAHEWMANYRNVDLQHSLNNVAVPIESYITPSDMEVSVKGQKIHLPQGTWILGTKVNDDKTWEAVKSGALTGYSVMGIKRTTMEAAVKSNENIALKKTLLRDLGEDWVPCAVSIVDEPAVPKAKFFAMKSKQEETLPQKIAGFFKSEKTIAEKAGRSISEANYKKLKNAFATLSEILDIADEERDSSGKNKESEGKMDREEMQELMATAIKQATEPLANEIKTLKEQLENKDHQETVPGPEKEEEETEKQGEFEAFKSEVDEKLDTIMEALKQKKIVAVPKGIQGQDGETTEESKFGALKNRDPFGRRI